MSKAQKERGTPAKGGADQADSQLIPPRYQHLAAIAVILLSLLVFFREPILEGKIFVTSDNIASHSFDPYLADAKSEGVFPLWNPYIFCGMPGYGSLTVSGDRWFDLTTRVLHAAQNAFGAVTMNLPVGNVLFYYAVFGIGMYLFVFSRIHSKSAALLASLATLYSLYIIIWIMAGHNTKIFAMSMFPYILWLVDQIREKFRWWHLALLVIAVHFLLASTHVQMIFYVFLAMGVLFFVQGVRAAFKKEPWKPVLRTVLAFAVAGILAFAMDSDRYISVLEYNPYSIRGSNPIIESASGAATKTTGGGLDYEYATNWSWGVGEMFTTIIPSLYGFGEVEYSGPLTAQPQRLNLYFGPEPFTTAPQYMGIVVLVLAGIGFWRNRKDPFIQYLGVMIVFSVLVAFGREFPVVYDLMYYHFPTFNKFRIPSMILVLVEIMVPILAAYGMVSLFQQRNQPLNPKQDKKWKYTVAVLGLLFIVGVVGRGLFAGVYEMFFPRQSVMQAMVQRGYPQNARVLDSLYDFIAGLAASDMTAAFGVLALAFGSLYWYLRRSLKFSTLVVLLGLSIVIDLWRVSGKAMDPMDPSAETQTFSPPPSVQAVLRQEGIADSAAPATPSPFRVLELVNGQPPYDNKLAYWRIQSAYGYQGAKMRRYQDLVDVVGLNNPILWQIMNVKYILTNQPDSSRWLSPLYNGPGEKVYVNRLVLPRAFFVNRYEVSDGLPLLRKIATGSFDPRDVVFLAEDPKASVDPPLPGAGATFVNYGIQSLSMNVKATGNNLLFVSESWYPKGWKAFVDGQETPIYRADYHFRAILVPPGTHTVSMVYESRAFDLGKNMSLGTNILVLTWLGVAGWNSWRKKKREV